MSEPSPFDIDAQRERIDAHKSQRLANPWKSIALSNMADDSLIQAFIEQIGDSELYQEEWKKRNERA